MWIQSCRSLTGSTSGVPVRRISKHGRSSSMRCFEWRSSHKGCSHCAKAKEYLPTFQKLYPGFKIEILDVVSILNPTGDTLNFTPASELEDPFPGFWICKQLVVGFDSEQDCGSAGLKRYSSDGPLSAKFHQPSPIELLQISFAVSLTLRMAFDPVFCF